MTASAVIVAWIACLVYDLLVIVPIVNNYSILSSWGDATLTDMTVILSVTLPPVTLIATSIICVGCALIRVGSKISGVPGKIVDRYYSFLGMWDKL